MEFFSKVPEFFKSMERGKLIRLIILSALIIVLAIVAATLLNQKSYSVLYSGMDTDDAGEVLQMLEDMGIDAKTRGDDTILVESSQADTLRMQLAAQGYPNSGQNFDIFQNASGLGTTDMEKEVYYQFQIQENLRRTIEKMDKVDEAVVNINPSQESAFVLSDNESSATAAVMLRLKNGQKINSTEVKAIAELVSKSVSGLAIEDVRIVDTQMNLYTLEDEDDFTNVNSQLDLQISVQDRLKEQIINLLNPVFGEGKVIAEVNVILDFDNKVTESVVFTPPVEGEGNNGIVISMKELSETINNYEGTDADVPGTDTNGAGSTYNVDDETASDAVYEKITREANMEINETKTLIENAKGTIKELSVSVVLDSSNSTVDYTENVKMLVANAIGVSEDNITVDMLPFRQMESNEAEAALANQKEIVESVQRTEIIKYIIIGFVGILILILLSAIIKSLTGQAVEYEDYEELDEYEEYGGFDAVAGDDGVRTVNADGTISERQPTEEEIDIQFEKKNTTLDQLGKYIDRSPESVAQLLKKWLYEDY